MRELLLTCWPWLAFWVLLTSLLSFFLMGWDKRQAVHKQHRIRERTLFLFALVGGCPGAILGMRFFHHKTKHWYFRYGLPAILVIQVGLITWALWSTGS